MKNLFLTILLVCAGCCSLVCEKQRPKVGLCIVATGRYNDSALHLVESARKYFCTDCDVTYYLFSDGTFPESPDIIHIEQTRLGWPNDVVKRLHIYNEHRNLLQNEDFIFAVDADMLFVGPVGREILSERVGVQHPRYIGNRGVFEKNKKSSAHVSKKKVAGKIYFAGDFFGGSKREFFKMLKNLTKKIDVDLENHIIAGWHDESYLNRYFFDHPPTKVLSPSYCYPESSDLPYEKKLLALDIPALKAMRQ